MKTFVLFVLIILSSAMLKAQSTDLPPPSANLQTLPAGSYVIAMDNTNQLNNSGVFNYKAYGLVVTLLNNKIKVKWVITAGKAKDGIDFTVNATKIKPTAGTAASYSFKAGPFVIFAADTTGVATLIDGFNSSISNDNDKIKVYQTNADITVDIRYDLTGFIPKAAILTDGGNQAIHISYMSTCNIPSSNYMTATGPDLLTKCFTFASEPHNTNTGREVDDAISAIKRFVEFGGNFLAQCEAVQTYENNVLGRFQTTTGITDANSTAGTAIGYPNPDLSFTQYEGSYSISKGGSLQNWWINAAGANNFHKHARATADTTVIGASVSKHKSGAGGLAFYIGNHRFDDQLTTLTSINGLRMYMNAFLTLVSIADSCTIGTVYMDPLGIRLISFQGSLNEQQVRLSWQVAENENIRHFEVERSRDGINFSFSAIVHGNNSTGNETYQHTEFMNAGKIFYRLKITEKSGMINNSGTILLRSITGNKPGIKIISNPVNDKLIFEFRAESTGPVHVRIIDIQGCLQMKQVINSTEGNNVVSISLPSDIQKGMFVAEISSDQFLYIAKFVKQ